MTVFAAPGARGALLVPMKDFAQEFEHESNLWYDYDHIPERLSCDGILFCERLELYPIEPIGWTPNQAWSKHLLVYSLASIDVLKSPGYLLQKTLNSGRGSVWRQKQSARQKAAQGPKGRSIRTAWIERNVLWERRRPIEMPEPRVYLIHLRHDLGEMDEAVNDFIDKRFAPELLMLPGFLACERYEAANILYSKSLGEKATFRHPKYMDIFSLSTPEVLISGIYRQYMQSLKSFDQEMIRAWTPIGSGVYFQRPSPWRVMVK